MTNQIPLTVASDIFFCSDGMRSQCHIQTNNRNIDYIVAIKCYRLRMCTGSMIYYAHDCFLWNKSLNKYAYDCHNLMRIIRFMRANIMSIRFCVTTLQRCKLMLRNTPLKRASTAALPIIIIYNNAFNHNEIIELLSFPFRNIKFSGNEGWTIFASPCSCGFLVNISNFPANIFSSSALRK